MSNLKPWILAALSIVLLGAAWAMGYLSTAFNFVDDHPWTATAAAAAVTAIATLFIARYTRATLRLFELEESRFQALDAKFIGECAHFLAYLEIAREHLKFAMNRPESRLFLPPEKAIRDARQVLEMFYKQLPEIEEIAQKVSPDRVHYIRKSRRVARDSMLAVDRELDMWDSLSEDGEELSQERCETALGRVVEEIEQLIDYLASDPSVREESRPLIAPLFRVEGDD